MKTKIEIIDETVEYYSVPGRRSVSASGSCMYCGPDGKRCAFGRVVENPEDLMEGDCASAQAAYAIIKEEYQGHSWDFWNDIQVIHDRNDFWYEQGQCMTAKGNERVALLKRKYCEVPTTPSTE